MYKIVRSDDEIDDLLNDCSMAEMDGSKYPGMTFEQGVEYAIKWVTDRESSHPLED